MIRFFKHLFGRQRKKQLEEWLLAKYEPAIKYYNDSDRFDPLSHLLIDLGETYMSISYNEKTTMIPLCGITLKFLQPKGSFLYS